MLCESRVFSHFRFPSLFSSQVLEVRFVMFLWLLYVWIVGRCVFGLPSFGRCCVIIILGWLVNLLRVLINVYLKLRERKYHKLQVSSLFCSYIWVFCYPFCFTSHYLLKWPTCGSSVMRGGCCSIVASSAVLLEALSESSLPDPDGSWSLCGAGGSAIISERHMVIALRMVDTLIMILLRYKMRWYGTHPG